MRKNPPYNKLVNPLKLLLALGFCLFILNAAHSAALVSNLDEPGTGRGAFVGALNGGAVHQSLAQSFTAGQAANLEGVTLSLVDSGSTTDFTIRLYNDVAGSPGSILSTFSGNPNPPSGQLIYFDPDFSFLAEGTSYWIVASAPTSASNKQWTITVSDNEQGESSWSLGDVGKFRFNEGVWQPSTLDSGAWQMSVNGFLVPEPTSTALITIGFLCLLLNRFRRTLR